MAFDFLVPPRIIVGQNALQEAVPVWKAGGTRALIVTDPSMVQLGHAAMLEELLHIFFHCIHPFLNRSSQFFLKSISKNFFASPKSITTQSRDLSGSRVSGSSFKSRSASHVAPALYRNSLFFSEISKEDRLVRHAS